MAFRSSRTRPNRRFETRFKDLAAFGEITGHITSSWSVTGGTRIFKQTLSQAQQTGILFDGPISIDNNSLSDSWRRVLWKLNTSFELDRNNLLYATWSQGFRRGSVNALPPTEPAVSYVTNPGLYRVAPDTADNYEFGAKGTVDNHFRYSAAIYDIQWHHVQEGAQLTPLVLPGAINVGEAYSRGVETELFANLTQHLSMQFDYTYDFTRLTSFSSLAVQGLSVPPPAVGSALPGTPKQSVVIAVSYGHMSVAGGELAYELDAHYRSSVIPALSATIPSVPGYTMLNTRLNFTEGHWRGSLYVDNLTNQLGVESYGTRSITVPTTKRSSPGRGRTASASGIRSRVGEPIAGFSGPACSPGGRDAGCRLE